MTPEERDLIAGLYDRLRAADVADKDREAEDLIRRKVGENPAAPYLLTQTVLVQEQALKGAESRIAALESQLANAQRGASAAPASGSFLSRARRPWETPSAQPAPAYQPPPQPAYAPPGYAPSAGGGFLHSALSTAAGVAGGALLFEGIERMLGHGSGPFGGYASGSPWGGAGVPSENVTVNNYYGDNAAADGTTEAREASYDPDDGGGDFDGGGDSGGGDLV